MEAGKTGKHFFKQWAGRLLEHAGSGVTESERLYATLGDAQTLSVAPLDRIQSFLEDLTLDKEKERGKKNRMAKR